MRVLSRVQEKIPVNEVRLLYHDWALMLYQETKKFRFDRLENDGV